MNPSASAVPVRSENTSLNNLVLVAFANVPAALAIIEIGRVYGVTICTPIAPRAILDSRGTRVSGRGTSFLG